LRAFNPLFERTLDVEKWWALYWLNFTGGDTSFMWPLAQSWQQLDEAIHPSIQIGSALNQPAGHAAVTLQRIIQEWEAQKQVEVLENKLSEVGLMRLRLDPRVRPIADEYRQILRAYLQVWNPYRTAGTLPKKNTLKHAKEQTLRQLDHVDAVRQTLQPRTEPLANAETTGLRP
jgi:hypothetical protein